MTDGENDETTVDYEVVAAFEQDIVIVEYRLNQFDEVRLSKNGWIMLLSPMKMLSWSSSSTLSRRWVKKDIEVVGKMSKSHERKKKKSLYVTDC